jgi:hypothetical protein
LIRTLRDSVPKLLVQVKQRQHLPKDAAAFVIFAALLNLGKGESRSN